MNGPSGRRCAVVYNPIKASDDLREAITRQATATGWEDADLAGDPSRDPGPAITDHVVSAGVDRVIAAGGDGTVRIVADRLAETGIPMAVVPLGTGNLLARNLDIPLSEAEALEVAFGDHTRDIDLIKVTVDGAPGEHFAVIGGLGRRCHDHGRDQPGAQGRDRCRGLLHCGRQGPRAYTDQHADHP